MLFIPGGVAVQHVALRQPKQNRAWCGVWKFLPAFVNTSRSVFWFGWIYWSWIAEFRVGNQGL